VCAEVFVKAGVARVNLDYDPNVEGSEPILIDQPHLLASFDETKVTLESTTTSKGKQDRGLRAGVENNGECFVTKSSSCAIVVCGRLGTGEALPPCTIFASGNTYHPAWAPHFLSNIKNKDGEYMAWRYASNEEGSLNEEGDVDYVMKVLHQVVGSPPSRNDARGHQGVVICDGVGTHIGFAVLETEVEFGLEVVLQGEDIVSFSVLKVKLLTHHITQIVLLCFNTCTLLTCYFMAHASRMEEDRTRDASGDQHLRQRQHALTTSTPQVQTLRTNVQGGLVQGIHPVAEHEGLGKGGYLTKIQ
jgi:hypothetical protein